MPNEISDEFHKIENTIGRALNDWEKSFVSAVKAEFGQIEPDLVALGMTVSSEIMTAAGAVYTGGATLPQALEVVVQQLPEELAHLGHIVTTLLGLAVHKMQADASAEKSAT